MAETEDYYVVKLYCPSTSKLVSYTASGTDKIDLGAIARIFGLEPLSVKLNGHFIGRGPELVAGSVTWRGLIKFFSQRGLPTGIDTGGGDCGHPLVVNGKILKPPNKRSYHPSDSEHLAQGISALKEADSCVRTSSNLIWMPNKKPKQRNTGYNDVDGSIKNADRHRCKRKHLLEDVLLMKKLKIDETSPCNSFQGAKRKILSHLSSRSSKLVRCEKCNELISDNIWGPKQEATQSIQ